MVLGIDVIVDCGGANGLRNSLGIDTSFDSSGGGSPGFRLDYYRSYCHLQIQRTTIFVKFAVVRPRLQNCNGAVAGESAGTVNPTSSQPTDFRLKMLILGSGSGCSETSRRAYRRRRWCFATACEVGRCLNAELHCYIIFITISPRSFQPSNPFD